MFHLADLLLLEEFRTCPCANVHVFNKHYISLVVTKLLTACSHQAHYDLLAPPTSLVSFSVYAYIYREREMCDVHRDKGTRSQATYPAFLPKQDTYIKQQIATRRLEVVRKTSVSGSQPLTPGITLRH